MGTPQDTSVQYLKGIGPKRAKAFAKAGVNTVEDLLYYFPRRYEDRSNFAQISQLKEKEVYTIKAEVLSVKERRSFRRRGFSITEALVKDASGILSCVWFNQPYIKEYLKPGESLVLYGKAELYGAKLQMTNPEFEETGPEDESLNVGRIVPVYPLAAGFSQRSMRQLIKGALDKYLSKIQDCLPFDIRGRNNILNLAQSLLNIHFPESEEAHKQAYERLSFEEFFFFQLPLALRKLNKREKEGIVHKVEGELVEDYISGLPFKLTNSQNTVIKEIKADMSAPAAMQRLLQGDVGSGKTVVAMAAAMIAIQGGYQAAFMVPTEILAKQHYEKIKNQRSLPGRQAGKIKIGLLTGSADNKEKQKLYKEIKEGKIDLIIGTHALLDEAVQFKKLGLVIIDEQHKFGVGQRALLPKKGANPDVLIMTATPIPRTLAITIYGDLDISVINELPPGRIPIKTMHFAENRRKEAFRLAREELEYGRQAYIIYPVIEESYALDMSGAKKMYEELKEGEFKEFKLGLIHGRLKEPAQDKVMQDFKNKKIDLLIATTVLEVGIDIPNATCMIIEHAYRFGLSQLHQLRGRIGRSNLASFCILISSAKTPDAGARMEAMVKYADGFRIAEEDLKIRGPGEFFGRRQHGLSELKIANPLTQMHLLKKAREEALGLVKQDPRLAERAHALVKAGLLRRFPEYEKLIMVG
ncbi:MAG: ATP-dependent DNA helicase RecG [Candidatus Omnitrophica bacterium]|nr:ATP-dependent DNA helicase RecG [Candidatus Omnitrophota bacterium]